MEKDNRIERGIIALGPQSSQYSYFFFLIFEEEIDAFVRIEKNSVFERRLIFLTNNVKIFIRKHSAV